MGHALDALPQGVRNVRENPTLFAIGYAVTIAMIPLGIVGAIVAVVLAFVPIVGQVLARLIVAVPLKVVVFGGMVGAVGAGFAGSVTFGDYVDAVRDNVKSLFGAFALYEVIVFSIGLAVAVVALFAFGLGSLLGSPTSGPPVSMTSLGVGMIALYLGVVVLLLAVAIVFQFLDVAVVLGDHGAVDAFAESWRLTREAPLSVLGYSVMRVLLGTAIVLPGYVVIVAGEMGSDVLTWVGVVITLLLYPVAFTVVMSYHAAYYGTRLKAA